MTKIIECMEDCEYFVINSVEHSAFQMEFKKGATVMIDDEFFFYPDGDRGYVPPEFKEISKEAK